MSDYVLFTDNVVFESIEHLNMFSNVEVKLPDNIPIGCNLVCYKVQGCNVSFFSFYKETEQDLCTLKSSKDGYVWVSSFSSLQAEIEFAKDCLASKYIYVQVNRKTPKEETKDLFTPDCLVGVETDKGYIDDVRRVYLTPFHTKPIIFVHTNDGLYFTDAIKLKYYISDESDTTVSFTDYVEMFYDGWGNECSK